LSKNSVELRAWTIEQSVETYGLRSWGAPYFDVDQQGDVVVQPSGDPSRQVPLRRLVEDLKKRGFDTPVLLRFPQILEHRVSTLSGAFGNSIREYGYGGVYRPVFPIKVNQQRDIVEELVEYGREHRLGLEAGSKPELLVALAYMDNPEGLIICNGFKDRSYIETALLAQKLGRYPLIVVDRYAELESIVAVSQDLGLRPHIGVRSRLTTRGAGKWFESTGERSKFGLTADELVRVVDRLREVDMLDCLELLHFHIGSQITAIRAIKDALRESSRIFVELRAMGAGLKFLDVGGGLAVDYDGSKTNFHSSANYDLQEYANDVVAAIQSACDEHGMPHPDIISESGRALVAHNSVLVFDVLGHTAIEAEPIPEGASEHEAAPIGKLLESYHQLNRKNLQETYHDSLEAKEEAISLFNLGYLDLRGRAIAERLFWLINVQIKRLVADADYVPEDFANLERALCDTYYCNFSVFQSAPDHWAVKQLFPVMPIHRLREEPRRRAVLADLTCDSDGKVDEFIDLHDVKHALELHEPRAGEPYYLAMFLVGAYQEILGDLHNLFGDTHAIHVSVDEPGGYSIDRVVEGDCMQEVLGYVQYEKAGLIRRVRRAGEAALRRGDVDLDEMALLLRRYDEALAGYTYLQRDEVVSHTAAGGVAGDSVQAQPSA
jgi:arginine decarboxylase